jgi:hypothetical protein
VRMALNLNYNRKFSVTVALMLIIFLHQMVLDLIIHVDGLVALPCTLYCVINYDYFGIKHCLLGAKPNIGISLSLRMPKNQNRTRRI